MKPPSIHRTLIAAAAAWPLVLLCAPAPRLPAQELLPPAAPEPIESDLTFLAEEPLATEEYCCDESGRFGRFGIVWPSFSLFGSERHRGWGEPLVGTSWLNRPFYGGVFTGGMFGGEAIAGRVDRQGAILTGLRAGLDLTHYWGAELRIAHSEHDLRFHQTNRTPFDSQEMLLDGSILYYPLGDARWRPYGSLGAGLARFEFLDDLGQQVDETLFTLPLGGGLKLFFLPWMTFRFDLVDNLAFSSTRLATMNNFSLTGGLEIRYGGPRKTYYPFETRRNPP